MQDYRIDYVIVDGQNGRAVDGWCYLPLDGELPSLDWLSDEVTGQLRGQGQLIGSDRVRVTSCRPRAEVAQ